MYYLFIIYYSLSIIHYDYYYYYYYYVPASMAASVGEKEARCLCKLLACSGPLFRMIERLASQVYVFNPVDTASEFLVGAAVLIALVCLWQ